jgi:Tfp pilus assembly PilM family ATPase
MLAPGKDAGKMASGKAKVQIAIHALQLAMIDVGAMGPEGSAILKAISSLTKEFGKTEEQSKSLMPAEIQQIMQKQPAKPPMGAAPPGAGVPPPAPPGP